MSVVVGRRELEVPNACCSELLNVTEEDTMVGNEHDTHVSQVLVSSTFFSAQLPHSIGSSHLRWTWR